MKRVMLLLSLFLPCVAQAEEGCQLDLGTMQWEFLTVDTPIVPEAVHASIQIRCEAGMDYRIEVANAQAGGVIELSGLDGPVPARLIQGEQGMTPWGSEMHGEAIEGTGTGEVQLIAIQAHLGIERVPVPGSYALPLDIRVHF